MKYEECWTLLQIDLVLDSPGNCDASNLMLQDVAWIIIDCHRLMIGYPQMIRYHCRNILEFTAFTSLGSSQISWVFASSAIRCRGFMPSSSAGEGLILTPGWQDYMMRRQWEIK